MVYEYWLKLLYCTGMRKWHSQIVAQLISGKKRIPGPWDYQPGKLSQV